MDRTQLRLPILLGALLIGSHLAGSGAADPEETRLRNELGMTYVQDGHFEDGLRTFTLILAEEPENPAALNNAANAYFLLGETKRARELYQRAIAARPDEGGIHLNLGILLHRLGEEEASTVSVRRGLELVGNVEEAYYLLGLSSQPPAKGRSSETGDTHGAEIEELLARASTDIPASVKAKDPKPKDTTTAQQTTGQDKASGEPASEDGKIKTRPGGAKAAQAETKLDSSRLFWMKLPKNP